MYTTLTDYTPPRYSSGPTRRFEGVVMTGSVAVHEVVRLVPARGKYLGQQQQHRSLQFHNGTMIPSALCHNLDHGGALC